MSLSYQNTPQELDFLINELRNPPAGSTVSKTLGYLFHYVPTVKNEHNLRLIIASFLNSPICFSGNIPLEQSSAIIEVFKLITEKKLKMSQPSLDIKTFYTVLLMELRNFVHYDNTNSWKVLPVIAGIVLANDLRDLLYTRTNFIEYQWFFSDWDGEFRSLFKKSLDFSLSNVYNDDIINLSILSLAVTFKKDVHGYTKKHLDGFMIQKLVNVIFNENYKIIFDEPVQNRYINKLSFLLEAYLKGLPMDRRSFELIDYTVTTMLNFNKELNFLTEKSKFNSADQSISPEFWIYMKGILFGEIVIFQGILTRFLQSKRRYTFFANSLESEYKQTSLKILHCLYYLNFILLAIGQGGFDNYNFVYYLTIEIAVHSESFPQLTLNTVGWTEVNLYPRNLNNNYLQRLKVLFTLGLWENYLQLAAKNDTFIKEQIFPVCISLADDKKYSSLDIVEAAHSTLLFCFSNVELDRKSVGRYVDYIQLLFSQFPGSLSLHQLSIAVETLGKKILSSSTGLEKPRHDFLQFILQRGANSALGIPILKSTNIVFNSAQPIPEIDASSTLSNFNKSELEDMKDIISANKGEEPLLNLVSSVPNLVKGYAKDARGLVEEYAPHVGSMIDEYTKVQHVQNEEARLTPDTVREAYILCFINLVPYLPVSSLLGWLDKLWAVILRSNGPEREFLVGMLWRVLGENLDLNRMELALGWWYTEKGVPRSRL